MVGFLLLLLVLLKMLLPTIILVVLICFVVSKLNKMEELNNTKKSAQTLWYLTGAMYFLRKILKMKWW